MVVSTRGRLLCPMIPTEVSWLWTFSASVLLDDIFPAKSMTFKMLNYEQRIHGL
jgi:hypothetical protein